MEGSRLCTHVEQMKGRISTLQYVVFDSLVHNRLNLNALHVKHPEDYLCNLF